MHSQPRARAIPLPRWRWAGRLLWPIKIRNKILVLGAVLTALPLALFAILTIHQGTSYVSLEKARQCQDQARQLGLFIDFYFIEQFRGLDRHLSQWLASKPDLARSPVLLLDLLMGHSPHIRALAAYNAEGERVPRLGSQQSPADPYTASVSHNDWLPFPSSHPQQFTLSIGKATYVSALESAVIPIQVTLSPVSNSKQAIHTIMIFYTLNPLQDLLQQWGLTPDSDVVLLNHQGDVLFHPYAPPGTTAKELNLPEISPDRVSSAPRHNDYFTLDIIATTNLKGEKVIRAFAPCPTLNWGLFLEQSAEVPSHQINQWRMMLLAFLTGSLMVCIIIGFGFIRRFLTPIEELEAGIQLFETGLLAEPLPIRSQDEIGRLTHAFNQMARKLWSRDEEVREKTRKLTLFNEITSIINQSKDLNTFLEKSILNILQLFRAHWGWFYIYDPAHKRFRLLAPQGVPETFQPQLENPDLINHLNRMLLTYGKPQYMRHAIRRLPGFGRMPEEEIDNLLIVPLHSKQRLVGMMAVGAGRLHVNPYRDFNLLQRIGNELGVAIENALLYIELQIKFQELERANTGLRELDRFKNRILSNVSHELRTPLTSIKTYVELFLTGKIGNLNAQQTEKMQIISRNLNQLLPIINDLLASAKGQALPNLPQEDVVAQDLVDQVLADMHELARSKHLKLERQGVQTPLCIRVYRQKFIQLLRNLIANAIKFTDTGSVTVDVKIISGTKSSDSEEEDVQRLEINIVDTGIGIPPEALDKIFQRFFQVDSSSTRKYVGTGLGLAIAKEILAAHHETLHVESVLGAGSRFWFSLPIIQQPDLDSPATLE